ncbi:MAG: CARDB domain-containing protein [Christensenella sp.]|nr:CARDB domain-containing protein [Christensenella sp.]
MKKAISVILVIALALALCISVGTVAYAEGTVKLRISVNPGSLTGAGTVKLSAEVINETDGEISGVVLNYPNGSGDPVGLDSIPAGESRSHSNSSWSISDDMLGTDLTFTADFTAADGSAKQVSATLNIAKKESVVSVSGEASADKTTINAEDAVNFTFVLRNDGNVTIENCKLKAPPISGGAQIGDTFSLSAGQQRKLTWKITMSESTEVKPAFTYTVNGENKTLTLDPINISTGTEQKGALTVSAKADSSTVDAGGTTQFTVTVKNTGNSDLSNLKVIDQNGNKVSMEATSVSAGSSVNGTMKTTVEKAGSYTFTATADGADGNSVTAKSSAVAIEVGAQATASIDPASIVRLDVGISATSLSKAGPVNFEFKIINGSGQALQNVVVSEPTLGEIANIPSMADAEQTVTKTVEVDKTTAYAFTVTAQLPDGTQVTSSTPSVTISVQQTGGGMTGLLILMIVIICAIIGVAIALGVMVHKNKKAGGQAKKNAKHPSQPRSAQQQDRQRAQQQRQTQARSPQQRQTQAKPTTRQGRRMPQESIEPHTAKKRRPPQGNGSGHYSDRNKF